MSADSAYTRMDSSSTNWAWGYGCLKLQFGRAAVFELDFQ